MRRSSSLEREPWKREPWKGVRRLCWAWVLAPLVAAAAAGCDGGGGSDAYFGTTRREGKDPDTFYVNNGSEPEYLDPGKSQDLASGALILQLFEGLTTFHPEDLRPTQGVAVRWDQSDDGRLYRFHLRPDAKWSDGTQVTAGDFEYAWKRVLAPRTASRAAPNLYALKNGELVNRGKLKAVRADLRLLTEPRPDAPPGPALSKGAFVRLIERSPAAPLPGAPAVPGYALVERFTELPTFTPGPPRAPAPAPERERGFIAEADLVDGGAALGVRATDDLTLDVELERPTPYFTDLTSSPTLFPVRRDVVERFEQRGEPELWVRPENIVVNGPYTLDQWKFRYEITMKQNPHYWDRDRLRIRRIVWLEVEDFRSTTNLYKAGEIDYIGDALALPAEYMGLLASKRDFRRFAYLSTYWYELNTRKPPLDNAGVRRALNLAVDKLEIVEKIARGGQLPASHYVPDSTGRGYAEQAAADRAAGKDPFSAPDVLFNPERARALLEQAGYPVVREGDGYRASGFPPLEILYNVNEGNRHVAVAVQSMWKRHLGISASLRSEDWKVMLKNVRDGHFQVVRLGQSANYNHPHAFLEPFLSESPQNYTGWADKELDAAVERGLSASDPIESIRLYREAEARALAGMSRIPLFFYTKSTLIKPWVKGFHGNLRNVHLVKWLWLDPDWQKNSDNAPAFPPPLLPEPGRIEAP